MFILFIELWKISSFLSHILWSFIRPCIRTVESVFFKAPVSDCVKLNLDSLSYASAVAIAIAITLKFRLEALEVFITSLQLWGTTFRSASVTTSQLFNPSKKQKRHKSIELQNKRQSQRKTLTGRKAKIAHKTISPHNSPNDNSCLKDESLLSKLHDNVDQEDSPALAATDANDDIEVLKCSR